METKQCGNCKHYAQGKTCSFCANEKQPETGKKGYCYYTFGCDLHEKGTHQTRIEYMKRLEK